MKTLHLSSSGLCGFAGLSLTPRAIVDFASSLATYVQGGQIVMGRDTRYSSPMAYSAAISGLLNAGCDIIDLGICPTPLIQFAVRHYGAAAGLSITGGHKQAGWNTLTIIGNEGNLFDPLSAQTVLDTFHSKEFLKANWQGMGKITQSNSFLSSYLDNLKNSVNTEAIRAAQFTVLMDPLGGAGVPYMNAIAEHLGLNIIPINGNANGYLAREAEPRPRSASQIASIIPYVKGDAGFLFSSDIVRMSLVTEAPEPKSEEYTFAIITNHILSKQQGTIVTNCATSRMIDDIVAKHKSRLVKTKASQPYVLTALADEQGILGGEGNGAVVLPKAGPSFDGFIAMALILEAMAENKAPLSELVAALPAYHIVKRNVPCTSSKGYRALEHVEQIWRSETPENINVQDGLRVDYDHGWKHVRISRTERIIRIISESKDRALAEEEAENIIRIVEEVL
jgi:phosphomannomutase